MTDDDLTPERLDALLDATASPQTQAERDLLALAARMRAGEPRASAALRERVRGVAAEAAAPASGRSWARRWRPVLVAGPALAAVAALIIGIGVWTSGGGTATNDEIAVRSTTKASAETVPSAGFDAAQHGAAVSGAQGTPPANGATQADTAAARLQVPKGTLGARVGEIRRLVAAAGGEVVETASPDGAALAITLPPDRAPGVVAAVARLATGPPPAIAIDPLGRARLLVSEAPG